MPDDHVFFAIFGGSLGAVGSVRAADAAPRWSDRVAMTIRRLRDSDHAAIVERLDLPADAAFTHQLIEYEDDMPTVYAAADFVVCRAGASSVAEVAVAGLPSVLVPCRAHPAITRPATCLVDAGAAVLVADGELDADRFAAEVDLVDDPDRLASMAGASSVARPDAAVAAVDLLDQHASRPRPDAVSRRNTTMTPDLVETRHIHLVGAGGAGMGAIADVLHRMGRTFTGSDLKEGPVVERCRSPAWRSTSVTTP